MDDLDHRETIQRYLQEDGYFTAIAGKYLNKWDLEKDPPYFDRWAIHPGAELNRHYYYDGQWNVQGERRTIHEYSTRFVTSKALDFLEAAGQGEDPWFLYVAPQAPHADYDEPPLVEPRFKDAPIPRFRPNPAVKETDLEDKPPFISNIPPPATEPDLVRRRQLRSLKSVDDMVAQLFEQLEETGQDENTLVIFLSDNGYLWGEHGLVTKLYPYTPSVRIPLLMRWPGHVEAGEKDDRLAANLDIASTIMSAAGLSSRESMDGHSLLDPQWDRTRLLLEGWGWSYLDLPKWASIRTKSEQYIEYNREGRVIAREYYRVDEDPWQLENLARSPSERRRLKTLATWLDHDRACSGSDCP